MLSPPESDSGLRITDSPKFPTRHEVEPLVLLKSLNTYSDTASDADGPALGHQLQKLQTRPQEKLPIMAPAPRRDLLAKEHFSFVFGGARTQSYLDPATKGPGSHTLRTLAWNPAGQLIATGSADRTLRIWNPERAHVRYSTELRGHSGAVEKVLFNPVRDAELASCSADGTVRFWDVRSKTCVSRLDVGGEAFTLSWSADGSTMLVGRKDDTLIPVSVQSPSTPTLLSNGTGPVNGSGMEFSSKPDSTIYTALPSHPQSVQTNATTFSHHIASPDSPDLHLFLTTGEGRVKIVSYPSFETIHTLNAHTSACNAISLAPNGRYLAVGGSDALISLWDTTDWICRRTCSSDNGGAIRGVSWSFDGRFICGASDEPDTSSGLEIFHAETGESVYNIPAAGPRSGIPAVAWHPSRYWLAYSTTNDGPSGGSLKIIGAGGGGL